MSEDEWKRATCVVKGGPWNAVIDNVVVLDGTNKNINIPNKCTHCGCFFDVYVTEVEWKSRRKPYRCPNCKRKVYGCNG
jgi:hypothetical protein